MDKLRMTFHPGASGVIFLAILQASLSGVTNRFSGIERITHGQDAVQGAYPYQVSIWWGFPLEINSTHICGGTILNNEWVLSAAHCFTDLPTYGTVTVYAGKHLINVVETTEQSSNISQTIIHPLFEGGENPHDLALLRMSTPFDYTSAIAAVALPSQNVFHTGNATVTGWGSTSLTENPIMPNVLQMATVPIIDNTACYSALFDLVGDNPLNETYNICTGSLSALGVGFCAGDSGGPLTQFTNGYWQLVGIVSWGVYPCGVPGMPSVYVRVSSYTDWILAQVTQYNRKAA